MGNGRGGFPLVFVGSRIRPGKISLRDKYHSQDKIHIASSASMEIRHIGHTTIPTFARDLHLNNILHVPIAAKNLIYVHRLAKDNSTYVQFHPDYFLVKDQATRSTLLRGTMPQRPFIPFLQHIT